MIGRFCLLLLIKVLGLHTAPAGGCRGRRRSSQNGGVQRSVADMFTNVNSKRKCEVPNEVGESDDSPASEPDEKKKKIKHEEEDKKTSQRLEKCFLFG